MVKLHCSTKISDFCFQHIWKWILNQFFVLNPNPWSKLRSYGPFAHNSRFFPRISAKSRILRKWNIILSFCFLHSINRHSVVNFQKTKCKKVENCIFGGISNLKILKILQFSNIFWTPFWIFFVELSYISHTHSFVIWR